MSEKRKLFNKGFSSLMVAQFFGAVNDNLMKQVLSFAVAAGGIWANQLGGDGGQAYVALCLTVPFILLSGFAGQIVDRTSKRSVILQVKFAEIGIALIALAGFWIGNLWICLGSMLLLGIQSAFFGPAKYGVIPELVERQDLSQANGAINMSTNIAIIIGTLVAGPIYGLYAPKEGAGQGWAPGACLLVVALCGLAAATFLPRLRAMDPNLVIDRNPLGPYIPAIREMAKSSLLTVACAWAFFYMVGMMAILILPDYRALLGVSPWEASVLLGVLGVAIGAGSVIAGWKSGKAIEPRLIPVGAVGMTIFFFLLGTTPLNYWLVAGLLFGAGFFAGFYIVPLQALLQFLSPEAERGRFLGTSNALSFVASTIGSLVFLAAKSQFGMSSNRVFLLCGILALFGTGLLLWRLRKVISDPKLREG